MVLNGSTDFVAIPDNSSLAISDNLTLEAWINACTSSGIIIDKNFCDGTQAGFHWNFTNGKLVYTWSSFINCDNVNSYSSDNMVLNLNSWMHVAVVHKSSGISLYVNGSPVSKSLTIGSFSTLNINNNPLFIGVYEGIAVNYGDYFKGQLDEVRIWNAALLPTQIQSNYNQALTGNEAGLVAYYNFEGISSAGQNITVPNRASSTGHINDGNTIGTASTPFFNNVTTFSCLTPQSITFNFIGNKSCNDSPLAITGTSS